MMVFQAIAAVAEAVASHGDHVDTSRSGQNTSAPWEHLFFGRCRCPGEDQILIAIDPSGCQHAGIAATAGNQHIGIRSQEERRNKPDLREHRPRCFSPGGFLFPFLLHSMFPMKKEDA
ncbi:MAG: hypothetical protein E7318_09405 [Clostridiales bacterium]|nr:hypothetical protein [Clostridiales bacterium]